MTFTQIDGIEFSLLQPYNRAKCEELIAAAFPPPAVPSPVGPEDRFLSVYLPSPISPETSAAAIATLTALGSDPTRMELTDEEAEINDLGNKINIADVNADRIRGIDAVDGNPAVAGLKDRLKGNINHNVPVGLDDELLSPAEFNALSAVERDRLLRKIMLDIIDIIFDTDNISLDTIRATRFLLRQELKEIE